MLDQGWEFFRGQGPIFWAAATAVAMGATLLCVTAGIMLRRLAERIRSRRDSPAGHSDISAVQERVVASEAALSAYRDNSREPANSAADSGRDLAPLLARLQETGDRLEEIHQALVARQARGRHSLLKGEGPGVEYVFRKGAG